MSDPTAVPPAAAGGDGGLGDLPLLAGATAFLGVEVDTSQTAQATKGAVISGALPNGAAAAAGIGQGDVITSLGGSSIDSANTLTNVIGRYHPGDKVPVIWTDASGQTHQATVTLANGPAA